MENHNKGEFEIDLLDLISSLWARKWIIIICGIIFSGAAGLLSNYVLPAKYESSTKFYVTSRQDNATITYNDLQTATQLTMDIQEIIISKPVLDQVISELELDIERDELSEMISVTIPDDTRIVVITVACADPNLARDIADQVREIAIEQIEGIMGITTINIVETASLPTEPTSPNIILNSIIGGTIGLLLSALVFIVIRLMDSTIKTSEDVERYVGTNVIACIPLDKQKHRQEIKRNPPVR